MSSSVSPGPSSPLLQHTASPDGEDSNTDDFQLPATATISLHVRRGEPQTRLRASKGLPNGVTWSHDTIDDNYGVLCGRIKGRLQGLNGVKWPQDARPFIRPKLSTSQQNYVELSEENFADEIKRAWTIERKRLGKSDGVKIHIFIYLVPSISNNRNPGTGKGLQRATDARIQLAREVISQGVQEGVINQIEPIGATHLSRTHARRPAIPPATESEVPATNTFQQTQHLDMQVQAHREKRRAESSEASDEYRCLRIKIHVGDLRRLIGLPAIDLTDLQDFGRDDVPDPVVDMEYVDHADDE